MNQIMSWASPHHYRSAQTDRTKGPITSSMNCTTISCVLMSIYMYVYVYTDNTYIHIYIYINVHILTVPMRKESSQNDRGFSFKAGMGTSGSSHVTNILSFPWMLHVRIYIYFKIIYMFHRLILVTCTWTPTSKTAIRSDIFLLYSNWHNSRTYEPWVAFHTRLSTVIHESSILQQDYIWPHDMPFHLPRGWQGASAHGNLLYVTQRNVFIKPIGSSTYTQPKV